MCFHHLCKAKYLGALNEQLSVEQKRYLKGTPFWWFTKLNELVKISHNMLSLLFNKWIERRGVFAVGNKVVQFNLLDMCLKLGLRICGEKIDLTKEVDDSESRKFFCSGKVNVKSIYEFLLKFDEDMGGVKVFYSLYILLGICEFLVPNRYGIVSPILFKIVDNVENIDEYNWGTIVYEYLACSLGSTSMALNNEKSTSHFHVVGCVYLVQVSVYCLFCLQVYYYILYIDV